MRLLFFTAVFSTLLIYPPAVVQGQSPRFEPVSCDSLDLSQNVVYILEGAEVECGFLEVPENRSRPGSRTIKLAVLTIKSENPNPGAPLVMTQGGPGGSGIELFAMLADPSNTTGEILRADRDLIIFEQRGTQYSEPFLACTEVLETDIANLEKQVPLEQELKEQKQAYQVCRQRLEDEGVDLEAYNSLENADDIADLAEALGYEKINYYGVSYGTQLGQHLMERHPEILDSVVLDGVVALDINPNQKIPWAFSRGLRELFSACQNDADCQKNYPDLENTYFETLELLDQNPAQVRLVDPDNGDVYQAVFDGEVLSYLTTQLLYATEALPLLPKMIFDAQEGVFKLPARILPVIIFDRTQADGMYMTVMCAEDFDFDVDELDKRDAYPALVEEQEADTELIKEICRDFAVSELGPEADQPVESDIPALLFSGFFDPVTPPDYADQLSRTLNNSFSYTFPTYGHGALLTGECPAKIVGDFLANPQSEPDGSCIQENAKLTFYTPANTIMAPAATKLSGLLENELSVALYGGDTSASFAAVTKALWLPVLMAWMLVIYPLIWVSIWAINKLRSKPSDKRLLAIIIPWAGVLLAGLVFLFTILYLVQSGMLLAGTGGWQSLAGPSRAFIWIYVLPWLIAAASIILAVFAALSWVKGYWGNGRRLYFSFTAATGVLFSFLLVLEGFLSVLFL